jgi:hypothetical protein
MKEEFEKEKQALLDAKNLELQYAKERQELNDSKLNEQLQDFELTLKKKQDEVDSLVLQQEKLKEDFHREKDDLKEFFEEKIKQSLKDLGKIYTIFRKI